MLPMQVSVVALSVGQAGGQFSVQECKIRVSQGWGKDFLCSGCALCWDTTNSAPFIADTCEATPRKSGDERMVPGDSSVVSQVSRE